MNWSELSNWQEYSKLLIGLFAMADPFSALPVFLGLTANSSVSEKLRVVRISTTAFIVTLLVFTFFGKAILDVFGISLAAFRIAGGILLLLTALDMMRSSGGESSNIKTVTQKLETIAIVPIAIPMLAGPGAISTTILYANAHASWEHSALVSLVILTVALLIYLTFRLAMSMGPLLGDTASIVMSKVMGLIVASIAIEFILHGLADHIPSLGIIH